MTHAGPLRVEVRVLREPARVSQPCPIEVRVTNAGQQPVVVCRRLAVGYRNSQARELFAEVYAPGTTDVQSQRTNLYERPRPASTDYQTLAPGDSIETEFNLFEWYALPSAGRYELVVFYQADEALAPKLPGLLAGTHASERVPLEVEAAA